MEPEETDLEDPAPDPVEPTPAPGTGKPPVEDRPDGPYCGPDYRVYTPTSKGGEYIKYFGATHSVTNRTSRTARSTFTAEASGEAGVSVTGGLATSIDVMIGKIEAKYDVNLSAKLSAKLGVSVAVDTPAKMTTFGRYGVFRLKNTGVSYIIKSNCTATPKKTVTSYTPKRVGWYIWES
ncbi:hypothetical protein ACH4SP_00565 [Streptomyces sp. NPDC021093]|uniref:hypothetical protein n=1 Tax=Streptomyces sp. NPDC021093 TaxID=3365112 RepID=UPI0037887340